MNELLDEPVIENNQKKFSKLSFSMALICLGLFSYLILSIPKVFKASEGISEPPLLVVTGILLSCLIGIITTAFSFIYKEPSTWFKWVGGFLNVLLFLFIFGSIVFTRTIDHSF